MTRNISGFYSACYPSPNLPNTSSGDTVTDTPELFTFPQHEVNISKFEPRIIDSIEQIIDRSERKGTEEGFVTLISSSEPIIEFASSDTENYIAEWAIERAFRSCSQRVDVKTVERQQLFHTHPRGAEARGISRKDIDAALLQQAEFTNKYGACVPFDMHALPLEFAKDGGFTIVAPPPLGRIINLNDPEDVARFYREHQRPPKPSFYATGRILLRSTLT